MRLIKMFGLAAIAAVAAMAFVGATSASANFNTSLCKVNSPLTCATGNQWMEKETIHLVNEGVGKLLSDLVDVLCLLVLVNAEALGLLATAPNPLTVHGVISFSGCGTSASHNNCAVTVEQQPLSNLLKTGVEEGSLTATNGQSRVLCEDIFGFIDIDCKYNTTGILFKATGLHLTANETKVNKVAGSALCPNESFLDGLLKTLPETPAHVKQ